MEISEQCVVGLTWTLKDTLGEVLDVLDEPVDFLVGGDDLFEAVEAALRGHQAGARLQLQLEPEQAFGEFDEQLLFLEPRKLFPPDMQEGMSFDGLALPAGVSDALPKNVFYTVAQIYPEHVVLDGNHPLAGIALRLELTVRSVREATDDEVTRGSAGTGFFTLRSMALGSDLLH